MQSHPDSTGGDDHDAVAQRAQLHARLGEGGERRYLREMGGLRMEDGGRAWRSAHALAQETYRA